MTRRYEIGVIPGDGTGPEVVAEGIKVLEALSRRFDLDFQLKWFDLGGERYLKSGVLLPDEVLQSIRETDAVFLGPSATPTSNRVSLRGRSF